MQENRETIENGLWWKENVQSRNKAMLERIETVRRKIAHHCQQ